MYKHTDSVPMRLSSAIAHLFMVYRETEVLKYRPLKPSLCKRYVEDIFVIWAN